MKRKQAKPYVDGATCADKIITRVQRAQARKGGSKRSLFTQRDVRRTDVGPGRLGWYASAKVDGRLNTCAVLITRDVNAPRIYGAWVLCPCALAYGGTGHYMPGYYSTLTGAVNDARAHIETETSAEEIMRRQALTSVGAAIAALRRAHEWLNNLDRTLRALDDSRAPGRPTVSTLFLDCMPNNFRGRRAISDAADGLRDVGTYLRGIIPSKQANEQANEQAKGGAS